MADSRRLPMAPVRPGTGIWTWEEYAALPENDGNRYQVLDGAIFVSPHPGLDHQRVLMALSAKLYAYVKAHSLGTLVPGANVVVGPGGYLIPDIVFLPEERTHGIKGPGDLWLEAPPALIVEVLSPATRRFDRVRKRDAYRDFGVDEYWIVDADARQVEVYRFAATAGDAQAEPEVFSDRLAWQPRHDLPALEIALAVIWT
jgi:Uma2 family endonuclease